MATDSEIAARLNEIGFPKPDHLRLPYQRALVRRKLECFLSGYLLILRDKDDGGCSISVHNQ